MNDIFPAARVLSYAEGLAQEAREGKVHGALVIEDRGKEGYQLAEIGSVTTRDGRAVLLMLQVALQSLLHQS